MGDSASSAGALYQLVWSDAYSDRLFLFTLQAEQSKPKHLWRSASQASAAARTQSDRQLRPSSSRNQGQNPSGASIWRKGGRILTALRRLTDVGPGDQQARRSTVSDTSEVPQPVSKGDIWAQLGYGEGPLTKSIQIKQTQPAASQGLAVVVEDEREGEGKSTYTCKRQVALHLSLWWSFFAHILMVVIHLAHAWS